MAERRYLDACVIISYTADEIGRADKIAAVLDEAADGTVEVFTSMLSIAEVAFGASVGSGGEVSEEVEERIDALWTPDSPLHLIEAHQGIMYRARDVMREQKLQGRSLKPPDAIHLATAVFYEIPTFFTYDDKLIALDGYEGLAVRAPEPLEHRLDLK